VSNPTEEGGFEDFWEAFAAFAIAASMNPMRKPPRLPVQFRIMRANPFPARRAR